MRGKRAEQVALQKMIHYCDEMARILEKHNFDRAEFETDTEFQFASGMCIIQIGELVAGLDEDFMMKYPEIPWRQIKGMRNIYAHDYDTIDNDMVWETVKEEIPELNEKLREVLRVINGGESDKEPKTIR